MEKWTRINYQPNLPLYPGKQVTASKEHIALSKRAAREGAVLLKNDGKVLPFKKGTRLVLLGKGTFDYVKGGGGSGDVTTPYVKNIYDGLKELPDRVSVFEPLCDFYKKNVKRQYEKGAEPGMTEEPDVPSNLIKEASAYTDTAVISISRFSGEGWDRSSVEMTDDPNRDPKVETLPQKCGRLFPDGDFYLSAGEKKLVRLAKKHFKHIVVVLNVGGVVDVSWFANDAKIEGALLTWQGGMEGGAAAAELLCGLETPSGKLPDTFAKKIEDYPSTEGFHESFTHVDYTEDIYTGYRYFVTIPDANKKVVYPFGYGLSYTVFFANVIDAGVAGDNFTFVIQVTNTGDYPGKEVMAVYASAPQGKLGKSARVLAAFKKTRVLAPGETCVVTLNFNKYDIASYDDTGKVCKSAYVLEAGDYNFYIGSDVNRAIHCDFVFTEKKDEIICKLSEKLAPVELKKRMLSDGSFEEMPQGEKRNPDETALGKITTNSEGEVCFPEVHGQERIAFADYFNQKAKKLSQVAEGKVKLEDFMDELSVEEKIALLGGQSNTGVANTFGIGNNFRRGIPNAMTADGPAGVRINPNVGVKTTAFPCSTLLASSWDVSLTEEVGFAGGEELKENNLAIWLTPAVNIHRNPLCGRNFEYYSEDPLLAGKMAAGMVRGIQNNNVGCSLKHFAFNDKETNRRNSDSRVSERAAREIYLKQFEIIVKEADPWTIMSSYNIVNGVRCSENRELLTDILRGEWGFKGLVETDWWGNGEHYKEIAAGNDVKMAHGYEDRVKKALDMGLISMEEINTSVERVLKLLLKLD